MTGRQRILAAIHGRPHDRVPVAQHNFPFAAHHGGIDLHQFRSDPDKAAQALADTAYDFGYDCIIIDFDTCTLAEAMGATLHLPKDEPARIAEPAVESLDQIVHLPLPDPNQDARLPLWLQTTRLLRQKVGDELAIMGRADQGPFGLAFLLRDSQQFMIDLLEQTPDSIHAALDHCTKAGVAFAQAQLEAGADLTSIGDSAAGQSLVSPDIYRRYAQPAQANYKAQLGSGLLSLHICGKTDVIVKDMVGTGCEVLELDHWNDLNNTFAVTQQRTCIWGNLDPSSVLYQGTPQLVMEKSRIAIEAARSAKARFVLCPGCLVNANTPPANIAAMTQAARQFGTY